jgi:hypothetical protein
MKMRLSLLLVALFALSLACETQGPNTPTFSEDAIKTSVASTLTAMVQGTHTNPSPSLTPTGTQVPCLPAHPGAQIIPLPAGIATGKNQNVSILNLQGSKLADRPVPGLTSMYSGRLHVAGNLGMGANAVPLVYVTFENSGTIKQNANNLISVLVAMPNASGVIGAEGNSFLAWATMDMMHQSINRLYADLPNNASGAQPRWTWTPTAQAPYGNAIAPLAIHLVSGTAQGIWFTYTMQGIGDILFPPFAGLSYFDLSTNSVTEYAPSSAGLGGLSPDQTWIAYAPNQAGHPGQIHTGFDVKNLVTCQSAHFNLEGDSAMGGGDMIFSPDGQFLAWLEAGGASPFEAVYRLKVARTDGTVIFNAPISTMGTLFGGVAPEYLTPMAWTSNNVLLLQAHVGQAHPAMIILWAPDPSQPIDPALGTHQSVTIGDGSFMGLVYP